MFREWENKKKKKNFRAVKNGLIAKEKDEESCELYITAGF